MSRLTAKQKAWVGDDWSRRSMMLYLHRIGAANALHWEQVEHDCQHITDNVVLSLDEEVGGLSPKMKTLLERAIVHGFVEGYVAASGLRFGKDMKASRKGTGKRVADKSASYERIRDLYRNQTHEKKAARVSAVCAALGVGRTKVFDAIKGLK
jgi:hypothetical protein